MTTVRLYRVRLAASSAELPRLLSELLAFRDFHPSERGDQQQDVRILRLGSRAHEAYSRASKLLERTNLKGVARVPASAYGASRADLVGTLAEFEDELGVIERNVDLVNDPGDRATIVGILTAIRNSSRTIFEDLQRLMVVPSPVREVAIEGFVPEPSMAELQARLGVFLRFSQAVQHRGPDDPYIPTLMANPRVISLFERIALLPGIPKYNEIDPTPIVAFVFPLFFGIMFGDLGHGLVLLAGGFVLTRRTAYVYWGQLISVLGASATFVGLLRGVVFGIVFPSPFQYLFDVPPFLKAELTFAYLPFLLEIAVVIGTFHLASAYVLATMNQLRSLRYEEAIFNGAPTLVCYTGFVALALALFGTGFRPATVLSSPVPTPLFDDLLGVRVPVSALAELAVPMVVGSLVLIALGPALLRMARGQARYSVRKALVEGASTSAVRPFDFFINTLSYIRLAALLVATTLLAQVIAQALTLGPAGYVLAAFLNVVVIAMEGLIVYLQDLRLNLFEWLTKFYSGTGTAFRPLAPVYGPVAGGATQRR